MKKITQLKQKDLKNKRVLVRVDYSVPIKAGKIVEASRLVESVPTIKFLVERGARVILVSHLGGDGRASLAPIASYLNKFFATKLVKKLDVKEIDKALDLAQIVLLENIRRYPGEQKNDLTFARQLAHLADYYVNDAFSVSHRAHASVSAITRYLPSYAGFLFIKEFANLSRGLKPKKPLVVILGGAKFKTKIPLIKKLTQTADKIFIVGALANSFMKAAGHDVGSSISEEDVSYIKPFLKNKKIIIPVDTVKNKKGQIVDIGPETLTLIKQAAKNSKMIIWNGPAGWIENGATSGTVTIAKIIASTKAFSIVGGGDTLAAISKLGAAKKFSHLSTAGGAMLDFLSSGTLPGIKALDKKINGK